MSSKVPKKLKTYFGFPVSHTGDAVEDAKKPKRGISLLIALLAISMMMGFMGDFIVTSSVNLEMATSVRDKVRSEYLAKSGMNLGLFFSSITWGIDIFRAQPEAPEGFKQALSDSDESYWNMVNSLPPLGSSSVEALESSSKMVDKKDDALNLSGVFGEEARNIMKLFEDQFTIKIEDEGYKININDCTKGRCLEVVDQLKALFSCPAEKEFLQTKNITPEQLAYRIKDFLSESSTTSVESGLNDKNDPYQKQNPVYSTKNGIPFYALSDLKLVDGMDDEIFAIFAPYLTVYPFNNVSKQQKSKININTAPREMLTCLVSESRQESCYEKFTLMITEKKAKQTKISTSENMDKTLKDMLCYDAGKKSDSSTEEASKSNLATWFGVKSDVLRFTITADTGKQNTKLEMVIRKIMPKDKSFNRSKQKVKRSYQILYWKMS